MDTHFCSIQIDGKPVTVSKEKTLLEGCWQSGAYVPSFCAHPDLPTAGMCKLCYVEREGEENPFLSCTKHPEEGMKISTQSAVLGALRQEMLSIILAGHPHICLTCPYKDGCDRVECTVGTPVEERCCKRFGDCEIQRVSDYIGIPAATPLYKHRNFQTWEKDPVITLDLNRCIGCMRCVDVCKDVMEYHVLFPFQTSGRTFVHPGDKDFSFGFKESSCKFCGACVEVCPAGAVLETGVNGNRWRDKTREKLHLHEVVLPSMKAVVPVAQIPVGPGVYRLRDAMGSVLFIEGTPSLRESLSKELGQRKDAVSYDYEEAVFYTQRANELLAAYLREHGKMPVGNDVDADLF